MIKYNVKIKEIREESPDIYTYMLEKPEDLTWYEGAHMHVALAGYVRGFTSLVRHLSIMSLPEEEYIGFTTRITSEPSSYKEKLYKLKVGDEVTIFKLASRMRLRRENRPIVLLSQGIAQATMRPLIGDYLRNKEGISLLVNVNVTGTGNFLYMNELQKYSGEFGYYLKNSRKEFYPEIDELVKLENPIFYVVGCNCFTRGVVQYLTERNIGREDIVLDMKPEKIEEIFNA